MPENNAYDVNDLSLHHTTQHYLDYHIQTVVSETFTIGGKPGQVICFIASIHKSTAIMSFTHVTIMKINDKHHKMPDQQLLRTNH